MLKSMRCEQSFNMYIYCCVLFYVIVALVYFYPIYLLQANLFKVSIRTLDFISCYLVKFNRSTEMNGFDPFLMGQV